MNWTPLVWQSAISLLGASGLCCGIAQDYSFCQNMILEETGRMEQSKSQEWWLNSGAYFSVSYGVGKTLAGELPAGDKFQLLYAKSNPRDTRNGFRPQNIFRLYTRQRFGNTDQGVYFKINYADLSDSPERDAWSGVHLFNRAQGEDGDNIYYSGIRVDGQAVIKKKIGGVYHTLVTKKVFQGKYDRELQPCLIPLYAWVGFRTVTETMLAGAVRITIYMDTGGGEWKKIVEAVDDGKTSGSPFLSGGFGGIRTDFMDAEFKNFYIHEF